MTITIKTINDRFYQVIERYKNNENCWEEDPLLFDNKIKKEYILLFREDLLQTLESFMDDNYEVDDFLMAFAAFCNCVIRYDLVERDDWTYYDALKSVVAFMSENILPKYCDELDEVHQLMLDICYIIVYNDYSNDGLLCKLYDLAKLDKPDRESGYTVFILYVFCYIMERSHFLFSAGRLMVSDDKKCKEVLDALVYYRNKAYRMMNSDCRDYTLGMNKYAIQTDTPLEDVLEKRLLPFFYIGSMKDVAAVYLDRDYQKASQLYTNRNQRKDLLDGFVQYFYDPDMSMEERNDFYESMIYLFTCIENLREMFEYSVDMKYYGYITRDMRPMKKNLFMHIPQILPPYIFFQGLLNDSIALDRAMAYKEELIRSFSHRFKNMRTTSLYNVAKALLAMDNKELKKCGRTVLLEYGVKENIIKEVEMLRLRYEDNKDQLLTLIRESESSESEDCNSTSDIVNKAIVRCVTTLVHDGSDEPKLIRRNCFKDYDLISLRNSFEEEVLFAEQPEAIAWLHQHIMPVSVSFSDTWKKLYFKKERGLDIILTDLMTDLIMNDFKYADKTQTVRFDFKEDQDFLIIETENKSVTNKDNIPGSNTGLLSQDEFISYLNSACGCADGSIFVLPVSDDSFGLEIRMSRKLFLEDE